MKTVTAILLRSLLIVGLSTVGLGDYILDSKQSRTVETDDWGERPTGDSQTDESAPNLGPNLSGLIWGEVCEGFQMSVHLQDTSFPIAEPIFVTVTVRNVSNEELTWIESDPEHDFDVTVMDVLGNRMVPKMKIKERDTQRVTLRRVHVSVPPGKAIEYRLDIRRYYILNDLGDYFATVSARVRKRESDESMTLRSNRISFSIRMGQAGSAHISRIAFAELNVEIGLTIETAEAIFRNESQGENGKGRSGLSVQADGDRDENESCKYRGYSAAIKLESGDLTLWTSMMKTGVGRCGLGAMEGEKS